MPLVISLALKPTLEPSSVWIYCLKDQFVWRNRSRPSRSQRVPQEEAFPKEVLVSFPVPSNCPSVKAKVLFSQFKEMRTTAKCLIKGTRSDMWPSQKTSIRVGT